MLFVNVCSNKFCYFFLCLESIGMCGNFAGILCLRNDSGILKAKGGEIKVAIRLKNTLYTIEDIKLVDGQLCCVSNEDGTLFSGRYRTKIKPTDLPPWYLYGRYYNRWGYMSAKGITDMVYIPNKSRNHFLKDDCLLISYSGSILEKPGGKGCVHEDYEGWDQCVWGSEIITILRGARKYSSYDIEPFVEKIRGKKEYMNEMFPDHFDPDRWNKIDVDALFSEQ